MVWQATVGRAGVVTWTELAQKSPLFLRCSRDALANQLTKHPDKSAMRSHSPRANHRQPKLVAEIHGLFIQIVENLHVIREKPDRMEDH